MQRRSDGDDPGKLDIRTMRFSHTARRINVRVRMDERWRSRVLRRDRYVLVDLITRPGTEGYFVRAKYRDGKLKGYVERIRDDRSRERIGRARVGRPDRKTIRLSVRRGLVRAKGDRRVRWNAQTYDGTYADVAPAYDSTYRHRL